MKKISTLVTLATLCGLSALAVAQESKTYLEKSNTTRLLKNAAGQTITVTANPTGANVQLNASTSTQTATIVGAVATPSLQVSPMSLSFGTVPTGGSSAAQTITLTNTGTAALGLGGIAFPVAQAAFPFTTTCGTSLAVGASCTVSMSFTPKTSGFQPPPSAPNPLEIRAKQPQNPVVQVTVTGTGQLYTYKWKAGTWSACSTTCGTGSQSRSVWCQRNDGTSVANTSCATAGTQPALTQSCTKVTGC